MRASFWRWLSHCRLCHSSVPMHSAVWVIDFNQTSLNLIFPGNPTNSFFLLFSFFPYQKTGKTKLINLWPCRSFNTPQKVKGAIKSGCGCFPIIHWLKATTIARNKIRNLGEKISPFIKGKSVTKGLQSSSGQKDIFSWYFSFLIRCSLKWIKQMGGRGEVSVETRSMLKAFP